jgi:dihydrofolate reductase
MPDDTSAPLTQYFVAASVDGFIATQDDDLGWLTGAETQDDESAGDNPYEEFMTGVGAIAMGATTYEWVLEHDPGDWGFAPPTWVFSHRDLPLAEGGGVIRVTSAPVREVHAEMMQAAQGRNVWLVGGGELVGQFLDEGLLDEIHLTIAPVVLGSGKPLLPRRTNQMRLLSTSSLAGGAMVHLRYSLR